ncbi:MAG: endonuclease/exonuclease/phosphatase family protein, partial [Alphaproteobacteria bacterium]|nr:endonuclease/exonuclease/phosphatase family protein [Alphaproteobacteria bacterium]
MKATGEVAGGGEEEGLFADVGTRGEGRLSMMCWNVCGWGRGGGEMEKMREGHDMRAKVIDFYKPDVVALVETWLRGEEEIAVEGYRWFGRNRRNLHRKAVRGSGGVGLLVREEVLEKWAVEVIDADIEDILWVKLSQGNEDTLILAACYIPPESSSRGQGAEETLQLLSEQVA